MWIGGWKTKLARKCFMNSILQCLSNTKELRDYCLQSQYVRDLNNNSRMQMSLMTEFAKLIQALWTSSPNESVSPSEFKMQIQRYAPRFVGYNQQDAQEFLRFLLDGLHSEVNRVLVRPKGNNDNLDHLPDDEKGRQMWMKYLAREDNLFVGQLKSSLTCSSCGYCSTAFDPFWDLSLPIAKKSYGEVNLIDCMRLFTKEDVLDGDEKPRHADLPGPPPQQRRLSPLLRAGQPVFPNVASRSRSPPLPTTHVPTERNPCNIPEEGREPSTSSETHQERVGECVETQDNGDLRDFFSKLGFPPLFS
ncbi:hypothetical protein E2320_007180 [Naja naja]|nr:hypothetical protein E2320_007180 [Naja naja]